MYFCVFLFLSSICIVLQPNVNEKLYGSKGQKCILDLCFDTQETKDL